MVLSFRPPLLKNKVVKALFYLEWNEVNRMLSVLFAAYKKRRSLEEKVLKIQKGDNVLRNELIQSFQPFVAKTVSSVCKRYINDSDDEFSIGLIAFNEAINKYCSKKGSSLLAFAEVMIKRRVIDYIRTQSKGPDVFLEGAASEEERGTPEFGDEKSIEEYEQQLESEKRREEIKAYTYHLEEFGISFSDLAIASPKHTDARKTAIHIAKLLVQNENLNNLLLTKKRLPVKQLEEMVTVSRKTIERNRKYIIAVAIILNGEYLFLNDYIKEGMAE